MSHPVRRLPGQKLLRLRRPGRVSQAAPHRTLHTARIQQQIRRKSSLWHAVSLPALNDPSISAVVKSQRLRQLAELARHLSNRISLSPPDGFVFEMRSSLRYFGGADAIRIQLQNLLEKQLQSWNMEPCFFQSIAPTAAASMLLTKTGANVLVYQTASLRSALGGLATASLPVSLRQKKQLEQGGFLYLRDIWRLPGAELRQRFGPELIDYLDCCLGKKKEELSLCDPLPAFHTRVELEYAVENQAGLMPVVQDLCARLCDYLRQQGLCTAHLLLQLQHENQEDATIEINLRRPSCDEQHLLMLLENRLGAMTLCAPVTALALETKYFDVFMARTAHLFPEKEERKTDDEQAKTLLEQLQSRLGNEAVLTIQMHEEHCPEFASRQLCYGGLKPTANRLPADCPKNTAGPRPLWLLEQPESLLEKNGSLFHIGPVSHSRLAIVSEVERIETRWWQGPDIRRDYYIAGDGEGHRYWIYRSRNEPAGWYLHGIF
jgi:protein ImuB